MPTGPAAAPGKPANISVMGAGAWGTALAIALARRHHVLLWGRNPTVMRELATRRENTVYLPGIAFPQKLQATFDFDAAVAHVCGADDANENLLIAGTAVAGLRPLAQRLAALPIPNLVWLCKGFEEKTGMLPHQVIREVMDDQLPCGALSGPSFALEVARGLPCALTIASASAQLRERVVAAVHGGNLRVYSSDDVIGVEVGGAVKNILAIATGVADGLGLGLNARAALITRGLAEITRLGIVLGGHSETFMGLAGIGDLMLTCTGDLSRNRKVGLCLAQGKKLETIIGELGHVAEGVRCAQTVRELARARGVEMPITNAVAGVLFDGNSPRAMVAQLLSRDPRDEAA